jgi:GNAT superfamily N-acetyltransferase
MKRSRQSRAIAREDKQVPASVTFQQADPATSPASDLLAAMGREIETMYDHALDAPDMPKAGPAEMSPPGGSLLLGVDEAGQVVCVGGIKRLPDGACEIKRMYVVPEARGRGIGRRLLLALEDEARALGYEIARLDTGPKQPGAQRMYEQAGYRPIDNFNENPVASFWGEKRLGHSGAEKRLGHSG